MWNTSHTSTRKFILDKLGIPEEAAECNLEELPPFLQYAIAKYLLDKNKDIIQVKF